MNKIDRLREAVIKGDKSRLIHSIFDFSEEDIIELTEQEFNEVIKCCSKIKLENVEEFLGFLFDEGMQEINKLEIKLSEKEALIGKFYLSIFLTLYSKPDNYFANAKEGLGNGCLRIAELGIDPRNNLDNAIKLYHEAGAIFPKESLDYAGINMNLGFAYKRLAELGVDPKNNLEEAIRLQNEARRIFPKNSIDYANSTMKMGTAHRTLAEFGFDPKNNLEEAIKLQKEASATFPKKSLNYARAISNMGVAYLFLAEYAIDPKNNLEEAIKLLQEAKNIFLKDVNRHDYPYVLTDLGIAHERLANLDVDPIKNLKESIILLQEARKSFPEKSKSPYHSRVTLILAVSHFKLAELGIEFEKNFKASEDLYEIGKDISFDIKDGWMYSVAVLNSCGGYMDMFWKNGDKSLLEKANKSLKEARNTIEAWEVLKKNEIFEMLCSVEADIFELKEDYYNAGIKYCEAYRLTKNLYYKFMYEYCEAKSSVKEKPFCKLVEKWKEYPKEKIFLDIYDYTIFECHLEEAINNEALRFDEINKAKIKLNEIFARTKIQHIKARANACMDILNSYLNYFPEKDDKRDEDKAKEHISRACRIFKEQGYIHEMHLCNLFIGAIKNKDKQEVWLDLIKNHLSNNLSKLIGEASINEIRKSLTIGIKADLGEIKAGIKEIKMNIDELVFSLKPGIREELVISVGTEFYGTGAQHVTTIPLQEISYHDLKKDLEKIKGKSFLKITSLPPKLAKKVKDYLIRNKMKIC